MHSHHSSLPEFPLDANSGAFTLPGSALHFQQQDDSGLLQGSTTSLQQPSSLQQQQQHQQQQQQLHQTAHSHSSYHHSISPSSSTSHRSSTPDYTLLPAPFVSGATNMASPSRQQQRSPMPHHHHHPHHHHDSNNKSTMIPPSHPHSNYASIPSIPGSGSRSNSISHGTAGAGGQKYSPGTLNFTVSPPPLNFVLGSGAHSNNSSNMTMTNSRSSSPSFHTSVGSSSGGSSQISGASIGTTSSGSSKSQWSNVAGANGSPYGNDTHMHTMEFPPNGHGWQDGHHHHQQQQQQQQHHHPHHQHSSSSPSHQQQHHPQHRRNSSGAHSGMSFQAHVASSLVLPHHTHSLHPPQHNTFRSPSPMHNTPSPQSIGGGGGFTYETKQQGQNGFKRESFSSPTASLQQQHHDAYIQQHQQQVKRESDASHDSLFGLDPHPQHHGHGVQHAHGHQGDGQHFESPILDDEFTGHTNTIVGTLHPPRGSVSSVGGGSTHSRTSSAASMLDIGTNHIPSIPHLPPPISVIASVIGSNGTQGNNSASGGMPTHSTRGRNIRKPAWKEMDAGEEADEEDEERQEEDEDQVQQNEFSEESAEDGSPDRRRRHGSFSRPAAVVASVVQATLASSSSYSYSGSGSGPKPPLPPGVVLAKRTPLPAGKEALVQATVLTTPPTGYIHRVGGSPILGTTAGLPRSNSMSGPVTASIIKKGGGVVAALPAASPRVRARTVRGGSFTAGGSRSSANTQSGGSGASPKTTSPNTSGGGNSPQNVPPIAQRSPLKRPLDGAYASAASPLLLPHQSMKLNKSSSASSGRGSFSSKSSSLNVEMGSVVTGIPVAVTATVSHSQGPAPVRAHPVVPQLVRSSTGGNSSTGNRNSHNSSSKEPTLAVVIPNRRASTSGSSGRTLNASAAAAAAVAASASVATSAGPYRHARTGSGDASVGSVPTGGHTRERSLTSYNESKFDNQMNAPTLNSPPLLHVNSFEPPSPIEPITSFESEYPQQGQQQQQQHQGSHHHHPPHHHQLFNDHQYPSEYAHHDLSAYRDANGHTSNAHHTQHHISLPEPHHDDGSISTDHFFSADTDYDGDFNTQQFDSTPSSHQTTPALGGIPETPRTQALSLLMRDTNFHSGSSGSSSSSSLNWNHAHQPMNRDFALQSAPLAPFNPNSHGPGGRSLPLAALAPSSVVNVASRHVSASTLAAPSSAKLSSVATTSSSTSNSSPMLKSHAESDHQSYMIDL